MQQYFHDLDAKYFDEMERWAAEGQEHQQIVDELEMWMGEEWVDEQSHSDITLGGDIELNPGPGKDEVPTVDQMASVHTSQIPILRQVRIGDGATRVTDGNTAGGGPIAENTPLDDSNGGEDSSKPNTPKQPKGKEKVTDENGDAEKETDDGELRGPWLELALELETQRRVLGKSLEYMDIAEVMITKQNRDPAIVKKMLEKHFEEELGKRFPTPPTDTQPTSKFNGKCNKCGKPGHKMSECKSSQWKPVARNANEKVAKAMMDWDSQLRAKMDALREMERDARDEASDKLEKAVPSKDEEGDKGNQQRGYDRDPHGKGFLPPEVHVSNVDKVSMFKLKWKRDATEVKTPFYTTLLLGSVMAMRQILRYTPMTHLELCTKMYNFSVVNVESSTVSEQQLAVLSSSIKTGAVGGLKEICNAWGLSPYYTPSEYISTFGLKPIMKCVVFGALLGVVADLGYAYFNSTVPYIRNNSAVNYVLGVPQYSYKLKFRKFIGDPYSIDTDKRHDMIAVSECKHYNPINAKLKLTQSYGPFGKSYTFPAYMGVVVQTANFANIHDGMDDATSKAKVEATLSRLGTVNYTRFSQLENNSPIENVKAVCGMIREAHKYHSPLNQHFQNPGGYAHTLSEPGTEKSPSLLSLISSLAPNSENWKSYCLVGLLSASVLGLMYGKQPYSIRILETGTQCRQEQGRDLLLRCLRSITLLPMSLESLLKTSVERGSPLCNPMKTLMSRIGCAIADTLESARRNF